VKQKHQQAFDRNDRLALANHEAISPTESGVSEVNSTAFVTESRIYMLGH